MEVKTTKDISEYNESIFWGLTLRQCVFSALAVLMAVGLYFLLRPYLGMETLSWLCIVGAAPFAAMGFVKYHGMNAEQFLVTWFRTVILEPKVLIFQPKNHYYDAAKPIIEKLEKEGFHEHDADNENISETK